MLQRGARALRATARLRMMPVPQAHKRAWPCDAALSNSLPSRQLKVPRTARARYQRWRTWTARHPAYTLMPATEASSASALLDAVGVAHPACTTGARIVCLVPSISELLIHLGLDGGAVGVVVGVVGGLDGELAHAL